jgi:DNA (cytosine-5)-methyltransferase 1
VQNLQKQNQESPGIISLFCGAGGLDLGFKDEGFRIEVAIDYDRSAISSHKKNFQLTTSIAADLTKIGPTGVLSQVKSRLKPGTRIGVIGGPPCQGFSRANPNSDPDDPRNSLPALYVEIIRELQTVFVVEFVVFENVLGMKDKKHSQKYKALISGLIDIGFCIDEKELCALDYGVPQNRRRIIVSAIRSGNNYPPIQIRKREGQQTVREAIGMLDEPVFFNRKLKSSDIPIHPNHWTMQPKSSRFTELNSPNKQTRSFRKLAWDKASPTIAFGNREIHVHPNGRRRLSIYEAMLLQGFPSKFVLEGTLSQQVTQISNAVPPPLARSVAAAVKSSLEHKSRDL